MGILAHDIYKNKTGYVLQNSGGFYLCMFQNELSLWDTDIEKAYVFYLKKQAYSHVEIRTNRKEGIVGDKAVRVTYTHVMRLSALKIKPIKKKEIK